MKSNPRWTRGLALVALVTILLAACSEGEPSTTRQDSTATGEIGSNSDDDSRDGGSVQSQSGNGRSQGVAQRIDPRRAGFDISLGEWAVTPEARAIRPGPVTFVITNRGTMDHGFEIEDDTDHSGSGGGEGLKFETELLAPGESTRFRLNLAPGTYKIECLVDGHDDMGMEGFLRVAEGARLVSQPDGNGSDDDQISIANFAFAPTTIEVPQGSQITWTNDDPTEHTVTAADGAFDSGVIAAGEKFSTRLQRPGTYEYLCNIHPDMTARVEVVR
jgi:plastocyanin